MAAQNVAARQLTKTYASRPLTATKSMEEAVLGGGSERVASQPTAAGEQDNASQKLKRPYTDIAFSLRKSIPELQQGT